MASTLSPSKSNHPLIFAYRSARPAPCRAASPHAKPGICPKRTYPAWAATRSTCGSPANIRRCAPPGCYPCRTTSFLPGERVNRSVLLSMKGERATPIQRYRHVMRRSRSAWGPIKAAIGRQQISRLIIFSSRISSNTLQIKNRKFASIKHVRR